ncbi:hypothetical protein CERZMDRAFT_101245 [Cercospora zeae-maydis SCOH1-5]|uniref:Uncharacterized protein n=1 Tax=Cercospora zeae-maydis SCOH1-5 TaxID=717836 RepID=A0A6A6F3J5_9PEZI|nr:hypothetical protein CERZMDRAFT_101245 [Cercospora zeae-maydis SCOH1-5]
MENGTSRAHPAPRSCVESKHRGLAPDQRLPQNMPPTRNASPEIPETPQGSPEPEPLFGENQAGRTHRAAPQSRSARDERAAAHNVPGRSKARGGAKILEREERQPSDVAMQLIRYTGIEARRQNDYTSEVLKKAPILNPYLLEMEKLGRDQPVRGEVPFDWQQARMNAGASIAPKVSGRALRIPLSSRVEGVAAAAAAATAATVAANVQGEPPNSTQRGLALDIYEWLGTPHDTATADGQQAVSTVLGIVTDGSPTHQRPKKKPRTDQAQEQHAADEMEIDSEPPRVKGKTHTGRQRLLSKNVNAKLKTHRVSDKDDEKKNNDIEMTDAQTFYRTTSQRTVPRSPSRSRPQRPSAAPTTTRNQYRELAYLVPAPDAPLFTSSIAQQTSSRNLTDPKVPRTVRPTWSSELMDNGSKYSPPTDEQTASILVGMQYKPAINEAMPYGDLKYRVESQSPFSEIERKRSKKTVEMAKKKEIEVIDLTMED